MMTYSCEFTSGPLAGRTIRVPFFNPNHVTEFVHVFAEGRATCTR